jgi:formylglycine-generating enzyme required for sulfatase activity
VTHPLSILLVLASPADLPPVDVEGETERLMQALGSLIDAGAIRVTVVRQADLLTVQSLLREEEVHILHFTGHALFDEDDGEGYFVLENEQGGSQPISGQKLGRLLHDEETLQLVSLNACSTAVDSASEPFSGVATALVQAGIPAVVAMQTQITDRAALQFAQVFYESLAYGYPVDAAVAEGRKAIDLAGTHSVEWAIPMLFMRVSDGMLFDFQSEFGEPEPVEELSEPLFTLTVVEGPLEGESFAIFDATVTIGRTPDNVIQIEDTQISRRHAQLEWRDDALWVTDLRSTNGTFLNDDRIEDARIMGSGDWLKIGQYTLVATFPGDKPMTPERFRRQRRRRQPTDIDKTVKPVIASIRGKTAAPPQPVQPGERPPVPVSSRDFHSEMLMQRVPASTFKYGPDQTEVELYEFEIDAWPVTNADYFIYIQTTGAQPPATWPQGTYPRERATHPVTGVSWDEAAAYAAWAGKRLPTAIEWEKAARGTDGRRFPWGDTFDQDRCNTLENNFNSTTPVGQYQNGISPYRVFDMAGNVWEWTTEEVQARGLGVSKTKRIRKGGAYNARQDAAECATQSSAWPDERADNVGFRCAR